jgi:tRNA(Ile)-lysidine synthase
MHSELSTFLESCKKQLQSAGRVYVGYSGGLDSTILLHAAVDLLGPEKLCVLHANHQLQSDADQWQTHCSDQAKKLGVDFDIIRLEISNRGQGIENEARLLRYDFFRRHLKEGDVLLLGHHMNDQAETLLYRLFRGAGARGLAAIPEQRKEGKGILIRPLLNFSREELRRAAEAMQLEWIEDPSNKDIGYDRNYIRSNVLPVILQRWPSANITLARAAANLGSTATLLDEYGADLLSQCGWRKAHWGNSFEIEPFRKMSAAAQAHLLTSAFETLSLKGFDSRYTDKVIDLITSAEDKSPLLQVDGSELRRFSDRLYLMPALPAIDNQNLEIRWDGKSALDISGCGRIESLERYSGGELTIGFRKAGERCKPLDRDRSQSLKKLLQEYRVEPWLRDRVPVVKREDKIVAVAGLFSCDPDLTAPRFDWHLG